MTLSKKQQQRRAAARTMKTRYGKDYFSRIGKKGGASPNNKTKFDEKSSRAAVNKRWENYRKRKEELANANTGTE